MSTNIIHVLGMEYLDDALSFAQIKTVDFELAFGRNSLRMVDMGWKLGRNQGPKNPVELG